MKSGFRRIVVGILVLVMSAGTVLLARDLWEQNKQDLALRALDILPDVAQRIRNFHRVKVENGRKVWEVFAREAQYFEDQGIVVVEEPRVSIFFDEGRTVAFRGGTGRVFLKGKDLARVEVSKDIEVYFGDYEMQTDFARYEVDREVIIAPGRVHISGDGFQLNGESMEVEVSTQRLRVTKDVRMKLWPG
jgi:LPS export ABC transporter protein LptC